MMSPVRSTIVAVALALGASRTGGSSEPPGWERLYEVAEKDARLSAVWADDAGTWVAGGKGVLVRGGPAGLEREPVGERTIVGLSSDGRGGVFAVGWDELVLHFDGKKWVEEHFKAGPPKGKRGRHNEDLLQHVADLPARARPALVAYGPWLVLIRQPDGSWRQPPENERYDLVMLAQTGPRTGRPAGCAGADWDWLANDRSLFSCHDNRAFLNSGGQAKELGVLPRECQAGIRPSAIRGSEVFTLCDGHIWRSAVNQWKRVTAPERIQAFTVAGRCIYVATNGAVSQHCDS
jgi:hypothetical protein